MAGMRTRVGSIARRSAAVVGVTGLVVLGAGVGTAHGADHRDGTTLGLSVEVEVTVAMLDAGRVRVSSGAGV